MKSVAETGSILASPKKSHYSYCRHCYTRRTSTFYITLPLRQAVLRQVITTFALKRLSPFSAVVSEDRTHKFWICSRMQRRLAIVGLDIGMHSNSKDCITVRDAVKCPKSKWIWSDWSSETGQTWFRRARFQTPNSMSFFGPHWVPGEFLSAYDLCAKANSPSFSQNAPSLPQSSVSSLFRNSTLEAGFSQLSVCDMTRQTGSSSDSRFD